MRSEAWTRRIGSAVGAVGGFILGYALVRTSGVKHGGWAITALVTLEGLIFAYLGSPYVWRWWRRWDARLKSAPLPDLLSAFFGTIAGLVVAVLIGFFVREFPYGVPLSAVLAALLAVVGANLGLNRRGEIGALISGKPVLGETSRRLQAALLDTSVIIDGRILDVARTGFIDIPLVVPRSVLKELQYVADSADAMRRGRGRRGLEVLESLQKLDNVDITFYEDDVTGHLDIDGRLLAMGKEFGWAVMTNDYNLNRIARLEGVTVLNLNELTNALKPIAIPGEELRLEVVREGKEAHQGVGYLDDGTMVVIENGRQFVNQSVTATVTSVLQTAAGRMIFAQAGSAVEVRRRRA